MMLFKSFGSLSRFSNLKFIKKTLGPAISGLINSVAVGWILLKYPALTFPVHYLGSLNTHPAKLNLFNLTNLLDI